MNTRILFNFSFLIFVVNLSSYGSLKAQIDVAPFIGIERGEIQLSSEEKAVVNSFKFGIPAYFGPKNLKLKAEFSFRYTSNSFDTISIKQSDLGFSPTIYWEFGIGSDKFKIFPFAEAGGPIEITTEKKVNSPMINERLNEKAQRLAVDGSLSAGLKFDKHFYLKFQRNYLVRPPKISANFKILPHPPNKRGIYIGRFF